MSEAAAEVVPLRTIALQWTRIGVTGFGGPPTHIALLRRLVVDQRAVGRPARVRGCAGRLQPPARPRLDPAGDLPCPAGRRPAWRRGRRPRLHRARRGPDHRAVRRVLRRDPARLGAWRRGRGGRRRGRGRGARGRRPGPAEPRPHAEPRPVVRLRRARGRRRGAGRSLPRAGAAGLRPARVRDRRRLRRPGAPHSWPCDRDAGASRPPPEVSARSPGSRSRSVRCPMAGAS